MKTYPLLLLISLMVLSGCSRKITIQDAYQLEDRGDRRNNSPTNRVDITSNYIGDAFQSITFQVDVVNRSDDSIRIAAADINLLLDRGGDRREFARAVTKKELIRALTKRYELLEQEKKASTTSSMIASGLGVLGGILAGAPPAETIIYGADSAGYIIEERQRYNLAEATLEEQIAYHEEYSLGVDVIAPGRHASYDLHFENPYHVGLAELEVFCTEHMYDFDYRMDVHEEKRRR